MKINLLKTLVLRNRTRCGLALLASLVSIWFALIPGVAQSKFQKRITSIQIGEANEGARVTVLSDSQLNDYEAFRRGDRFYVRIPLADFTAGRPGFRGDGFDDVQVQKVGDSVVISFKLQPGASARVDQRANRLEVIFSAPNRIAGSSRTSSGSTGSNRSAYIPADGIVRVNNPPATQHRQRDTAGPMPPDSPGSPTAKRDRLVTGATDYSARRSQPVNSVREEPIRKSSNRPTGNIASSTYMSGASSPGTKTAPSSGSSTSGQATTASKGGSASTVPRYQASPVASPSTSPNYPAFAGSSPAAPIGSPAAVKSPGLTGPQIGKSRTDIILQWVKANRQATLIGGLLALVLLVLVAALLVRRRKNVDKVKRSGKALAQPKQSADLATGSPAASAPVNSPTSNMASQNFVNENTPRTNGSAVKPTAAAVASGNGVRTSGVQENAQRARLVPEQATAQSAAATPNKAWVPVNHAQGSSADEDQEREVFEL